MMTMTMTMTMTMMMTMTQLPVKIYQREKITIIVNIIIFIVTSIFTEMEKRADDADTSVLLFSLAVLIFRLCTP